VNISNIKNVHFFNIYISENVIKNIDRYYLEDKNQYYKVVHTNLFKYEICKKELDLKDNH
jgi:hypothetical protein